MFLFRRKKETESSDEKQPENVEEGISEAQSVPQEPRIREGGSKNFLRSEIHKEFYGKLEAKINQIEDDFASAKLKLIRQRDIRRFRAYSECLKDPKNEIQQCASELKKSKQSLDLGQLDALKAELYTCVDSKYQSTSYRVLQKVGFDDCLGSFQEQVYSLLDQIE